VEALETWEYCAIVLYYSLYLYNATIIVYEIVYSKIDIETACVISLFNLYIPFEGHFCETSWLYGLCQESSFLVVQQMNI
jgi:hypothetical protein